jgi:hypothetical protein
MDQEMATTTTEVPISAGLPAACPEPATRLGALYALINEDPERLGHAGVGAFAASAIIRSHSAMAAAV